MAKLPAFQFYPGDWMKDADVRRCSIFARGLLVDLLCLCHESKHRGRLCESDGVTPWSNDDIVNALGGASREELLRGIEELERKGVLSRDDNRCLYSRRMVRDEEIRIKRAESGSAGGVAKSKQTSSKPLANDLAKPKQITEDEVEDEEEEEIKEKVSAKFTKPTLDEVREYCDERKLAGKQEVDPEAFHDFYESKGWKVGGQGMKDWKAAVRNWEKRDRGGGSLPILARARSDPSDPRGNIAAANDYLAERRNSHGEP